MKTTDTLMHVAGLGRCLNVGQFVPAAARTARQLTEQQLLGDGLGRLYAMRVETVGKIADTLPIETDLRGTLVGRLQGLNREITRYEQTPEFELPTLDPSFLSWKTKTGFPAFSIFSLEKDSMKIRFEHHTVSRNGPSRRLSRLYLENPLVPDFMGKHYLDEELRTSLEARCDNEQLQCLELEAVYRGAMPDDVREKVHGCLKAGGSAPKFDRILIIAEAPDECWQVRGIPQQDPLVVGISCKTPGLLWLIAAYDLTPSERFARELCTRAEAKFLN